MSRFEGKNVLITGGSRGIGSSIVTRFLDEGARVFTIGSNKDAMETFVASLNDKQRSHLGTGIGDLASHPDIERLIDEAKQFGHIDTIVNNAALHDYMQAGLEQTRDLWNRIFAINVTAPFLLSQAFLPGMIERGNGSIVNVSSAAGLVAGGGGVSYTTSKHALIGLTKQLAFEYGPRGVHVNVVCPGITQTPALDVALEGPGGDSLRGFIATTPARRICDPEEVANSILFLASAEARFMHGSVLVIDGGYSIF